ncbi:glycosyltransferase [Paenibacillus cellulositrophicus]|uniref:glycosyltransferase family 2 protein n=1 Tax=Paenibacillus cellulositrophicus TaxID=562959 RepID=UPI00203E1CBE|nr:glycosyltransferase [Paenibacillus cellulositrophicus]MCM3001860.1 glycosyltransferase [Paenibacillus cellulositrophicus]
MRKRSRKSMLAPVRRKRGRQRSRPRGRAIAVRGSVALMPVNRAEEGPLLEAAYQAGLLAGAGAMSEEAEALLHESQLQRTFADWCAAHVKKRPDIQAMLRLSRSYTSGYAKGSGRKDNRIPLPLAGSAAAVVCASNEEDTLGKVLQQLERLPLREVIVVLNGCRDQSYLVARKHRIASLLHFPDRLGHDVGRSVGAAMTSADIVLFTDGDVAISAEELAPFIYKVDEGVDAALNDLNPYLPLFGQQDEVTRCKSFLNTVLGHQELGANSLTAVPHALAGRLIADIGVGQLMVPPKAQALALAKGYHFALVKPVDVITANRKRPGNTGAGNAVADLIIGDHAEALHALLGAGWMPPASAGTRVEVALRRNAR